MKTPTGTPCPKCGTRYLWDWCQDVYRLGNGRIVTKEEQRSFPTVQQALDHYGAVPASGASKRDLRAGPVDEVGVLTCLKCKTFLSVAVLGKAFGLFVYSCPAWKDVDWEDSDKAYPVRHR